ncbi:hypothetical protein SS50377_26218 [Spironucleus salmonicida]|uniref:Uncharacterized protein n=1 Tax=Spironucleus salmonicida TaxID=348837 RepID=V6LEC9_9EUKA|nr:hypothetical protein SS50377_26218 [Spironucleus salmonicida]|eukprot:EST42832.1 Hypothetical protein SS50377_17517 [Spironucleus salmonicida]
MVPQNTIIPGPRRPRNVPLPLLHLASLGLLLASAQKHRLGLVCVGCLVVTFVQALLSSYILVFLSVQLTLTQGVSQAGMALLNLAGQLLVGL